MRSIRTDGRRRPLRSSLALVAALAVAVSGLTFGTVLSEQTTTESASAATAASFDPGNIISDVNFYNGSAMSSSSVQSFLNSVAPNCKQASGGPACLKNFSQNMSGIAAVSGRCSAINGGVKSAATVIAQVGAACGISQKVLLVLLQKEQGIVTTNSPTSYMYLHATGFACPDTAPCDPKYYGFGQQVYAAALQFKRYQASPTSWAYQAGRNNSILYNPNAACGRKTVYIKNQATAGLYIYTPYTPNAAAMSNLYGTGDGCSAYGNRNFWRMYTDWFGSPTGGSSPAGHVDSATAGFRQVTVGGWAYDPDVATSPIRVAFYVDGVGKKTITADGARSDLGSQLGAGNTSHGFSTTLTGISGGSHNVCVFGINQGAGANALLGCQQVTVRTGAPFGKLDQATLAADELSVRGWAIDPDTKSSIPVQLRVDGVAKKAWTASASRTDVGKIYPGWGDAHGYSATISGIGAGKHTISTWAKDTSTGKWTQLGAKTVTKASGSPWIVIDEASSTAPGKLKIRGWTADPDTIAPLRVHLYLDGKALTSFTADQTKAGLDKALPGYGDDHAILFTRSSVPAGKHQLCIIAINVGPGGNSNVCTTFQTPTGPPKVKIESGSSPTLGSLQVSGYAVDPDTVQPIGVTYTVDGKKVTTGTADQASATAAKAYPGYYSKHGFQATLTGIGPGKHTVCVVGTNVGGGKDASACSTVAMTSGNPVLLLDEVSSPAAGQVKVRGWTIDPDTASPIQVHVYVNGAGAKSLTANEAKASLATTYGGYGANHSFSTTVSGYRAGSTQVCVYAMNTGAGANTTLCRTITVK